MKIYTAQNIRAWDAYTISEEPISSIDLMERAATSCTKHILGSYYFESALIICGPGNNGGDGLVVARLLAERGIHVSVLLLAIGTEKSEDYRTNLKHLPNEVKQLSHAEGDQLPTLDQDIIIDAIFGSGLNRGIENNWIGDIIDSVNDSGIPTISVDLPSGLFADQPLAPEFKAVKADKTITFQSPKMCFFFSENDAYIGKWSVIEIGLSANFSALEEAIFVEEENVALRKQHRSDHKGTNGFLSVIAGVGGMTGAAILSTKAAFRTGCGYVATTAIEESASIALLSAIPEGLLLDGQSFLLPEKTNAILLGPGIGKGEIALNWLKVVLSAGHPTIIDADGINLLAENPELLELLPANSILTPHLGELKRLIGKQEDSLALLNSQKAFSKKYAVYILQKGPNSKLSCPDGTVLINSTGNPGMATAGMGDVLSGMIGSFLAQGYSPKESAVNGMYYHGLAGDWVANNVGSRGMISSDVIEAIPKALQSY